MFASSVEVLGVAKSTIITINPLENVLPSGYDIGGVHQIVSTISNSQYAKKNTLIFTQGGSLADGAP